MKEPMMIGDLVARHFAAIEARKVEYMSRAAERDAWYRLQSAERAYKALEAERRKT